MYRRVHTFCDLERHVAYARRDVEPFWHALVTQGVVGAVHGGARILVVAVRAREQPR